MFSLDFFGSMGKERLRLGVNFPRRKMDTVSAISRSREKAGQDLFPSSVSAA